MDDKYAELIKTLPENSQELWFEYNLEVNRILQENTNLQERVDKLQQENQTQKEINRKTVDYVRKNSKKYYRDWGQDDCSTEIYLDEDEVFKLLEILEDKEV